MIGTTQLVSCFLCTATTVPWVEFHYLTSTPVEIHTTCSAEGVTHAHTSVLTLPLHVEWMQYSFHTHTAVACCIDVFFPRTLIHPTLASSQMMLVDVFSHTGLLDYASVKVRYQRMGTHTHWMSDGAWNVPSVTFVHSSLSRHASWPKGRNGLWSCCCVPSLLWCQPSWLVYSVLTVHTFNMQQYIVQTCRV